MNEYNIKAINDTYKNARIALQSISDILPSVISGGLKKELKEQYEGYDNLVGEISSFMLDNNLSPKDIGVLKKAMLMSSIKMKTLVNNSKNNIAELMIKGSMMGIIELRAMLNESKNLNDEVKGFIQRLATLEEEYLERLKKFL